MQPPPPPPSSTSTPPMSANGVVESLMESFCQCFGTESHLTTSQRQADDDDVIAAPSTPPRHGEDTSSAQTPSTPETKPKRPTNHLFTLQQKGKAQWNSFFFGQQIAPTTPLVVARYDSSTMTNIVTPPQPEFTSSTVTATSRRNRSKAHSNNTTNTSSVDLKSRNSNGKSTSPKSQNNRKSLTKRKRPASRDDIFRSKRDQQLQYVRQHASQFNHTNPNSSSNNHNYTSRNNISPFLSRFLSGSSPVCMATLCFATPIRGDSSFDDNELNNNTIGDDDDDDDDDAASSSNTNKNSADNTTGRNNNNGNHNDVASVVSDSNTLNTAEDTITSTLYYETTKLAGLKQTNPLMPLYNSHAVGHAKDDIHQIVHLRTQQQQQHNISPDRLQQQPFILTNRIPPQQYVPSIPSPHELLQENNMDDDEEDEDDGVVDEEGDDEHQHIYITNEGQTTKQQTPPLTPPKKGVSSGSTAALHYYSPTRIVADMDNTHHHHRSSLNGVQRPASNQSSPLPPVSKLSSDSSKS